MDVLISWSGKQSRHVALALHVWLPKVIPTIRPWMSKLDIDKGSRWSNELQEYLTHAKGCIVCLTPENVSSPWVYWETGAISSTQEHPICPLLIGISPEDIKHGPLSQYQCTHDEKDDVLLLVTTLNQRLDNPEDEDRLRGLFEKNWHELQKALSDVVRMGIPKNVLGLLDGLDGARAMFTRRWDTDKRAEGWELIKQLVNDTHSKVEKLVAEAAVDKRAQLHCDELKTRIRSITAYSGSKELAQERGDEIYPHFEKAIRAIRAEYDTKS